MVEGCMSELKQSALKLFVLFAMGAYVVWFWIMETDFVDE